MVQKFGSGKGKKDLPEVSTGRTSFSKIFVKEERPKFSKAVSHKKIPVTSPIVEVRRHFLEPRIILENLI